MAPYDKCQVCSCLVNEKVLNEERMNQCLFCCFELLQVAVVAAANEKLVCARQV
jgi:hypothetical protein